MINPLSDRAFKPDRAALRLMVLVIAAFWANGALAQTQAQALSEINAVMTVFKDVINAHTAAGDLDYTHLLPYFDANFKHDGAGANEIAADIADALRAGSVSAGSVDSIVSLTTDANGNSKASTTGSVSATTSEGSFSQTWSPSAPDFSDFAWFYKPAGGTWRLYGNQEPGKIRVKTFIENRQSGNACQGCDGAFYFTWFDTRMPQGQISSITVTGPGFDVTPLVIAETYSQEKQGSPLPAPVMSFPYQTFKFYGPAVSSLPPPGSVYAFTMTPTSGAPFQVTRTVPQTTSQTIAITSPTGHMLGDAQLGGALTLNWTLPTFPVQNIDLNVTTNSAAGMCNGPNPNNFFATNATSYTFSPMPTECLGQPIADNVSQGYPVQVTVDVTGTNGENTRAWYSFGTGTCNGINVPPGSLSASSVAANLVQLQWIRACMPTPIANYAVWRSTLPGGPFTLVGMTDQNTRNFNDSTASTGVTYYYYVTANDSSGNQSAASDQITVTTPGSIAAPGFTLPQGIIPEASVTVLATGTLSSKTLVVQLKIEDIFAQVFAGAFAASGYNVYVAALVPNERLGLPAGAGTWFVKARTTPGTGWELLSSPIKAFIEGVAVSQDQLVEVDILSSLDLSSLIGTEIYVGYGTSDDEMIQNRRYRGVFSVQP